MARSFWFFDTTGRRIEPPGTERRRDYTVLSLLFDICSRATLVLHLQGLNSSVRGSAAPLPPSPRRSRAGPFTCCVNQILWVRTTAWTPARKRRAIVSAVLLLPKTLDGDMLASCGSSVTELSGPVHL